MRPLVLVPACLLLSVACGLMPETDDRRIVHSGDIAVIVHGPRTDVPIALSKADAHTLARAVDTDDESAVLQMVNAGQATFVPSGVHVRVTGEFYNERRVQVTEGLHARKVGWVPFEWLSFRRS